MVLLYRVWTTGPFLPATASGSDEKSEMRRRCAGSWSRRCSRNATALVGMKSEDVRLGANGIPA
jgi:hypothetical protein